MVLHSEQVGVGEFGPLGVDVSLCFSVILLILVRRVSSRVDATGVQKGAVELQCGEGLFRDAVQRLTLTPCLNGFFGCRRKEARMQRNELSGLAEEEEEDVVAEPISKSV